MLLKTSPNKLSLFFISLFSYFSLVNSLHACELRLVEKFEHKIEHVSSIPSKVNLVKYEWNQQKIKAQLDTKFYQNYQQHICNMNGVMYSSEQYGKIFPFGTYEIRFVDSKHAKQAFNLSQESYGNRVIKPRKLASGYKFYLQDDSLFIFRLEGGSIERIEMEVVKRNNKS